MTAPQKPFDKRRELWKSILGRLYSEVPSERHIVAIEFLHLFFDGNRSADNSILLWQLLGAELGSSILEFMAACGDNLELGRGMCGEEISAFDGWTDAETRQFVLKALLDVQNVAAPPTHRKAVDPVPVLLPRALFEELRNALEALNKGEVLPLLEPRTKKRRASTKKRPGTWTWDEGRVRALEYVHFQRGRGKQLRAARWDVAEKICISDDTLRDWETDLKRSKSVRLRLEIAQAAGKLSIELDNDPNYGRRDGEAVDANEFAFMEGIRAEPLSSFAKRFQTVFGNQYRRELP